MFTSHINTEILLLKGKEGTTIEAKALIRPTTDLGTTTIIGTNNTHKIYTDEIQREENIKPSITVITRIS